MQEGAMSPISPQSTKEYLSENTKKRYSLKQLWGKQKEILRLVASGLYKKGEVAQMVGVTPATVSAICRSELGQQTLAMLEGAADADAVDLMVQIRALAPIALSVQEELLLDSDSEDMKYKVSRDLLDRAGYSPVKKNLNVNENKGLTAADIEHIAKRAAELEGRKREVAVDATLVE